MENQNKSTLFLKKNEYIMLDTSTIMEYERFKNFIEASLTFMLYSQKQFIIMKSVWAELIRHSQSEDYSRKCIANSSIALIDKYEEIFLIEDMTPSRSEISSAFADRDILSRLLLNKSCKKQLLIANDKDLVKDANNLNKQASYFGFPVQVCYLSYPGHLKMCDCVYEDNECKKIEKIIEVEKIVEVEKEIIVEKEKESQNFDVGSLLEGIAVGAFSILTGFLFAKSLGKVNLYSGG